MWTTWRCAGRRTVTPRRSWGSPSCVISICPKRRIEATSSAPALFGATRDGDEIWRPLAALIAALDAELRPALVLAPQGLGGHVDHRQMIRAVRDAVPTERIAWYRDTPYAIRDPEAVPDPAIPRLPEFCVPIGSALDRKAAAACAYRSQVGFQFGGAYAASAALCRFASTEGDGTPSERLLGSCLGALFPETSFRRRELAIAKPHCSSL